MQIASQQIAVVAEALALYGINPQPWLDRTGLPALAVMDQSGWRALGDLDAAMRMAQAAAGDPGFGLVVATSLAQARHGTLALLAMQAPTLRAILDDMGSFFGLLQERREVSYAVRGSHCEITFDPLGISKDGLRFRAEQIMGGLISLIRYCGATEADPPRAEFTHRAPAYAPRYSALFGPTVKFGQPRSLIAFPAALLDAAQAHRDATSYSVIRARAHGELDAIKRQNSTAGALKKILERGDPQTMTMPRAASVMGVSARTLRRKLIEEGVSFGQLLEEQRRGAAERLLRQGSMPLKSIAAHLGYRSTSSFHRAFKKHTTMTPLEWQRAQARPSAPIAEAPAR